MPVSSLGSNAEEDEPSLLEGAAGSAARTAISKSASSWTRWTEPSRHCPSRYRTVFQLCVREGRPYQEAADQLGLPTGTVAIRIMRARKRLFRELSHHLGRLRRPPACFQ